MNPNVNFRHFESTLAILVDAFCKEMVNKGKTIKNSFSLEDKYERIVVGLEASHWEKYSHYDFVKPIDVGLRMCEIFSDFNTVKVLRLEIMEYDINNQLKNDYEIHLEYSPKKQSYHGYYSGEKDYVNFDLGQDWSKILSHTFNKLNITYQIGYEEIQ